MRRLFASKLALLAAAWIVTAAAGVYAQTLSLPLSPAGIAYDRAGNLFLADAARQQVLESTVGGDLLVVAGTGVQGFAGDGGPATSGELNRPRAVAVGAGGTLYIADSGNQRIRSIDPAGTVRTIAGTGVRGFGGDGGAATAAQFNEPSAIAIAPDGAILVADSGNHRVRKLAGGVVQTIAGSGVQGFSGDGGVATRAALDTPLGVAVAADGTVVIADSHNNRLRAVSPAGIIATIAGTGATGFSGDGGPAVAADLASPRGIALLRDGSILFADSNNQRLRVVSASGVISTLAGTGVQGSGSDAADALSAPLDAPRGVAVTPFGNAAFADAHNRMVLALLDPGKLYRAGGLSAAHTSAVTLNVAATATYGSLSAALTVSGNAGVPRGTVSVREGTSPIASANLQNAQATVSLASLSAGAHQLAAAYAGDGFNPAASSLAATVVITPVLLGATATSATMVYGAAPPSIAGSLSGVLPQDAGNVEGLFTSSATAASSVGDYPIAVTLTGTASGNYQLGSGVALGVVHVVQAGTVTSMQPPSPGYSGLPMTLQATVASSTSGAPGGTVDFADNGQLIASAPVAGGKANAVYLAPASGTHALTATYRGDTNFLASTSAPQSATVSAMPDFAVSAANAQQTVQAGTLATFPITVSPAPGPFSGAVSFSVSGLPSGVTATLSPAVVVPGSSPATLTLSVPTAKLLVANHRAETLLAALGAPFLLLLAIRRKRRRFVAALLCLVTLAGCGARTVPEAVTQSRSYTLTVTGTGTNLAGSVVTHTAQVFLTVE